MTRHSGYWVVALAVIAACGYSPLYEVERQRVTRSSHTEHFPVASGVHGGADCNLCHGDFDTFSQFTCIGCHEHDETAVSPLHVGVAGYSYAATTCYDCHPTGERMSRAAHEPYFPIESGRHSLDCSACHVTSYASFECIQCHEHVCAESDSNHREVSGYSCQSARCYDCHPRGAAGD